MYTPADPLARPGAADRLVLLRVLCGGLAGALAVVTALIVLVVQFALGGLPLAGNAVQFGGVAAVTWAAVGLALAAPPAAVAVARGRTRAALADPAAAADPDRRLDAFAGATFVEYAVPLAAGAACALLYHVTADPLLLAAVAGLVLFLGTRFPTTARARRWLEAAGPAPRSAPPG